MTRKNIAALVLVLTLAHVPPVSAFYMTCQQYYAEAERPGRSWLQRHTDWRWWSNLEILAAERGARLFGDRLRPTQQIRHSFVRTESHSEQFHRIAARSDLRRGLQNRLGRLIGKWGGDGLWAFSI